MTTSQQRWANVPTETVIAVGEGFAVRQYGVPSPVPLVVLTHLGANLDNWDPAVVDAVARERQIVAIDYRGVGASTGRVQDRFEDMAADLVAVIRALGFDRVDLLGLSMGGMVVQALMEIKPDLVRRIVLSSTGPRHGQGLASMTRVAIRGTLTAALTRNDPKQLLFFTRSTAGRASAKAYLHRLTERSVDRDAPVTPAVFQAQLRAVKRWGVSPAPQGPLWDAPTLLLHGEDDIMVPSQNAAEMARLLPGSAVTVFPDSGHGVVFQHPEPAVNAITAFLRD